MQRTSCYTNHNLSTVGGMACRLNTNDIDNISIEQFPCVNFQENYRYGVTWSNCI